MTDNPYQSPVSADPVADNSPRMSTWALAAVRIPAISIVVLGIVSVYRDLPYVVSSFVALSAGSNEPGMTQKLPILACMNLTLLAIHIFTLYGAICMLRLRSLGLAQVAMAVALVPCLSPLLVVGIPFGVWGLIVLHLPHITAEFRK